MSVTYLVGNSEELLKQRKVIRLEDVGPSDLDRFQESIDWLRTQEDPEITIEFFSSGGCGKTGIAIHDLLRDYEGRKIGKVVDRCESAAMLVLQSCDERISYSSANFLVHHVRSRQVSLCMFDLSNPEDPRLNQKGLEDLRKGIEFNERYIEILFNNCFLSRNKLIELMNKDVRILPRQALELGMIDGIYCPSIKRRKKK